MKGLEKLLFGNIGERIKKVAFFATLIEAGICVLAGAIMMLLALAEGEFGLFLLTPVGIVLSVAIIWLTYIALYGFGELICHARNIDKATSQAKEDQQPSYVENLFNN